MSLRGTCHTWPNYTIHFYAGLRHMEDSSVSLSPIMLASVVIGFIITISCFFIILVSVYPKKPWDPPRHYHHYLGDPQDDQDSQERPRCRGGVHCTCGLRGDRLAASGCFHQDAPPSYEECTGPGATQLYLPTEAPPPYSPTDSDSDLHTVSVDALPPYEAVWAPCPPLSWLPLQGPEPEPSSPQGPPTPKGSRACSPEMIV
ncbi:unnamed protein product [Pipistrellus nathusii]|uniref:Protein BEAN1 n=1 Tax=Pipistrellus nathusii TaxID=59473 RepID=A0ABN9ZEA5_PIPNA